MTKRTNDSETENVDQNQSNKAAKGAKIFDGVTVAVAKPLVLAEHGDTTWLVENDDFKARPGPPRDAFDLPGKPRATPARLKEA